MRPQVDLSAANKPPDFSLWHHCLLNWIDLQSPVYRKAPKPALRFWWPLKPSLCVLWRDCRHFQNKSIPISSMHCKTFSSLIYLIQYFFGLFSETFSPLFPYLFWRGKLIFQKHGDLLISNTYIRKFPFKIKTPWEQQQQKKSMHFWKFVEKRLSVSSTNKDEFHRGCCPYWGS